MGHGTAGEWRWLRAQVRPYANVPVPRTDGDRALYRLISTPRYERQGEMAPDRASDPLALPTLPLRSACPCVRGPSGSTPRPPSRFAPRMDHSDELSMATSLRIFIDPSLPLHPGMFGSMSDQRSIAHRAVRLDHHREALSVRLKCRPAKTHVRFLRIRGAGGDHHRLATTLSGNWRSRDGGPRPTPEQARSLTAENEEGSDWRTVPGLDMTRSDSSRSIGVPMSVCRARRVLGRLRARPFLSPGLPNVGDRDRHGRYAGSTCGAARCPTGRVRVAMVLGSTVHRHRCRRSTTGSESPGSSERVHDVGDRLLDREHRRDV